MPNDILYKILFGRSAQVPQAKYKYSDVRSLFNTALADGKFTEDEANDFANYGITDVNKFRKIVQKTIDGKNLKKSDSDYLKNYLNGLERNYYIKDNKVYGEDEEGFDPNYYNLLVANGESGYFGTDRSALIRKWNNDLTSALKDTSKMIFDPVTGQVKYSFNGGEHVLKDASDDVRSKVSALWLKGNKDAIVYDPNNLTYNIGDKTIQNTDWMSLDLTSNLLAKAFGKEVDETIAKNSEAWSTKYNKDTMNGILGISDDEAKAENYSTLYHNKLLSHILSIINDPSQGEVYGSALLKYLTSEGLNSIKGENPVGFLENTRMYKAMQATNPNNSRYSYKNGGNIQYAGWGSVLTYVPVIGTAYLAYKMATLEEPLTAEDWLSLGISGVGDAMMFVPGIGTAAGTALKTATRLGARTTTKAAAKLISKIPGTKTTKNIYSAISGRIKNIIPKNKTWAEREWKLIENSKDFRGLTKKQLTTLRKQWLDQMNEALKAKNDKVISNLSYENRLKAHNRARGIVRTTGLGTGIGSREMYSLAHEVPEEQIEETPVVQEAPVVQEQVPVQQEVTSPRVTTNLTYRQQAPLDYTTTTTTHLFKNGGTLNMNNINYFQEGGAVAAPQQAAPAQGEQDIQQQVIQLVQAAMQGDEKATQAINQIMQAAQQGDQQAIQIAQMIQEVAKQMQGQSQVAKHGAKLAYIKSLKSGCPEGTTPKYFRKGGTLCKECVEASGKVKKEVSNEIPEVKNTPYFKSYTQEAPKAEATSKYSFKKGGELCSKLSKKGNKVEADKCGKKMKKCAPGAELDKCGSKMKKK